MSRRIGILLTSIVVMTAIVLGVPAVALAAQDDDIPGVPICQAQTGQVLVATDRFDVFRVYMLAGERFVFTLTELNPATSDLELWLFDTASTSTGTGNVVASATTGNPVEVMPYIAPTDGWYYVVVDAWPGAPPGGGYDLRFTRDWNGVAQPPAAPTRIWGAPLPTDDRYTVAVNVANANFPGWLNCDHVIIASGEDFAAADPLAASGLTWAYGAPILLVQGDRVPPSVMNALVAIGAANPGLTVHVVGGEDTVPPELLADIAANVPGVVFDRITPHRDRFVLAASIARRMEQVRPGGYHRTGLWNKVALVANGADYDKFFDALALSPLAARTGYPILLVQEDNIPSATKNVLTDLGVGLRVVGGGPDTVSDDVLNELRAGAASARWSGPDRYSTAVDIANQAAGAPSPWTMPHNVGVTAKLPDALTGGAFMGLRGSPMVLTQTDTLPASTRFYLQQNRTIVGESYIFGGPDSVTPDVSNAVLGALTP
jgi:putative cell wall-binding protein